MRADKKRARSKNKLADLFGMEAPETPNGPTAARIKNDNSREAEAVIEYISNAEKFRSKTCRHCGENFLVNRANVALCSDYCRAKELEAVGITWRWDREPEARWYYAYDGDSRTTEPLVIGPHATKMIDDNNLADEFAAIPITSNATIVDDSFLYGDFDG